MNNIFRFTAGALVASAGLMLTGCLDEVYPTSALTEEQLQQSPAAGQSLVMGMPAYFNNVGTIPGSNHFDWGYASWIYIWDSMCDDFLTPASGYDHFTYWTTNSIGLGEDYLVCQYPWWYFNKLAQTANLVVGTYAPMEGDAARGYEAVGRAFRASAYLDMAQMYEYLPAIPGQGEYTDKAKDGSSLIHLTTTIVTNETTEEQARHNPRVHRDKMVEFILSDLDFAEEHIAKVPRLAKSLPDLAVVYGLKARLYLWASCNTGDDATGENPEYFNKAAEYAQKAITESGCTALTESQWTSPEDGFNSCDSPAWLWGILVNGEDDVVKTSILNWPSWICNETNWGYAAVGNFVTVNKAFYDRISNNDFRKLSWIAPANSPLEGKEQFILGEFRAKDQNGNTDYKMYNPYMANWGPYMSLKFRPKGGQAGVETYQTGAAADVPLMRVEEMYFIKMEAEAHVNPAQGKQSLIDFMTGKSTSEAAARNPKYEFNGTTKAEIIDEIVFQKRVELWGEGRGFFDMKRLNMSVTRGYEGTNFPPTKQFNTIGRPTWMNFVIVRQEADNNDGVVGFNTPTPTGTYEELNFN